MLVVSLMNGATPTKLENPFNSSPQCVSITIPCLGVVLTLVAPDFSTLPRAIDVWKLIGQYLSQQRPDVTHALGQTDRLLG